MVLAWMPKEMRPCGGRAPRAGPHEGVLHPAAVRGGLTWMSLITTPVPRKA